MIWIDRSISKRVTYALNLVRGDVQWVVDLYPQDTPDEVWLTGAGKAEALVILRDKKVRTRPNERRRIIEGRIGCFIVNQKKNPTKWDYLKLLTARLDEMERSHIELDRPFIVTMDSQGTFRQIELAELRA